MDFTSILNSRVISFSQFNTVEKIVGELNDMITR